MDMLEETIRPGTSRGLDFVTLVGHRCDSPTSQPGKKYRETFAVAAEEEEVKNCPNKRYALIVLRTAQ